jgi:uncharacterized protein (TIRG00374 family)
VTGAKIVVAGVLLGWLLRSGTLDLRKLGLYLESPTLAAVAIATWFMGGIVIGMMRWRLLLGLADVVLPFRRALLLQMTGLFFNVAIPGAIGGDVLKALYVARDARPDARSAVLLIAFVERLLGLMGLILMAGLVVLPNAAMLSAIPSMRPVLATLGMLVTGVAVASFAPALIKSELALRIERHIQHRSSVAFRLLAKLMSAAQLLARGPRALAGALFLSLAMHAISLGLFVVLARAVNTAPVAVGPIAAVFPIGILTMALPIAPAGIGVGHIAFERLFAQVGVSGGATAFNLFLVGQIVPGLLGAVPYLFLKRTERAIELTAPSADTRSRSAAPRADQ